VRIEALTAHGVRNLAPLELVPRERFNVFVGNNGQGKTNLLEAIYAVAALRSFRTAKLAEMIAFGMPEARLGARVWKHDLHRVYELTIAPGARRAQLDGKAARPLSRYFGAFNIVVFTPEDLSLPRGSPGDRRRFLDRAVFNLDAEFLARAQDYDKVLRQRNSVLKLAGSGQLAPARVDEMLAVYDRQLATLGLDVVEARTSLVAAMSDEIDRAFQAIGRSPHRASARYASKAAGTTVDEFENALRESRAKDLATQSTQHGPHRDDLAFELDGRDAGAFASQGQLRAIMLAWKTAEVAMLERAHGDQPILLLDDVSSELDPDRNAFLFEHLASAAGQCFITTTHGSHVLIARDRQDYVVRSGEVRIQT